MRAATTPRKIVQRARIVLLAGQGEPNQAIARTAGTSRPTVLLWRRRFAEGGVAALLHERPRSGRRPSLSDEAIQRVVDATLRAAPAGGPRWSVRTMARAQGVGRTTVHRIWRQYGLQPRRVEQLAPSRRARLLVDGLEAVAGLYLDPPARALAVSVAASSGGATAGEGGGERGHRPAALFAALRRLDELVTEAGDRRDRPRALLGFLGRVERAARDGAKVHVLLGASAGASEQVQRWLRRHPRLASEVAPSTGSWLRLVERRLRVRSADGAAALVAAIERCAGADRPARVAWTSRRRPGRPH